MSGFIHPLRASTFGFVCFIHPLRFARLFEPDVKLGSLTLIRHKMTLSHFSKGLIRPVSGGESG